MASISREPNGRRRIQFTAADGRRRSIRLGKVTQKQAEAVKVRIERLVAAGITGHAVDDETARWAASLDDALAEKLSRAGLIAERHYATLGPFLEDYFCKRIDVKPSTLEVWGHTRRNLLEFFGTGKPLRDITAGDAAEWRLYLIGLPLADTTVRKRCGFAKQFFAAASKKRLVTENAFIDLPSSARGNPSRFYFVTREEAAKVLDACPDAEWRLIFGLARYGGLRCPSETLKLRWEDVNWAENRFTVHSPKTEHHPGGESRVVPIFPELRPLFEAAWEASKPGAEYVITRYRDTRTNLRTQLRRIIRRAGLAPWTKPWVNLRSTRETELVESHPLHVVCAWIGNSQPIAAKHYLQVTDEHFAKAIRNSSPGDQGGAESGSPVVQNAAQQPAAAFRKEPQGSTQITRRSGVMPIPASICDVVQSHQAEGRGLEPPTGYPAPDFESGR